MCSLSLSPSLSLMTTCLDAEHETESTTWMIRMSMSLGINTTRMVTETMPLYDILNEFQKDSVTDVKVDIDGEKTPHEKALKAKRSLRK
ncbi:hypothetical protein CsSME_00047966 [Camellia sinensis var. sinensis]